MRSHSFVLRYMHLGIALRAISGLQYLGDGRAISGLDVYQSIRLSAFPNLSGLLDIQTCKLHFSPSERENREDGGKNESRKEGLAVHIQGSAKRWALGCVNPAF